MREELTAPRPETVQPFISRFRAEILGEWQRTAHRIPVASELRSTDLSDHIPELLDQVAEIADQPAPGDESNGKLETARRHAVSRLGEGFDVSTVVRELSILRRIVLEIWDREHEGRDGAGFRAIVIAFDRAVADSVSRYVEAHDRTLSAIDTISTASLEATSLANLLQRLLSVFMRTTDSVQTCAILLRDDDDRLHTRAAVGLEGEVDLGHAVAKGEGFAGQVWAHGGPIELQSAHTDPVIKSPVIRAKGVRALYGIPLARDGRVIGVAHMGSISANQFSQDDKQLFASMCARATVGILHHMLLARLAASEERSKKLAQERERALAKLEALLEAAPVGIGFLDRELRYLRANDALAEWNGKPAALHIGRTVSEVLPDVADTVGPMLRRVLESGEPVKNVSFKRPDGRDLLANYFPVRDATGTVSGVGGIVFDVSEERRTQEALSVERTRLQSIVDYTPAAIWIKDAEGRIILANRRLADALGCPYETLIGRRSDEILPDEVAAEHHAHDLTVMRENRAIEAEESVPGPNGVRTFLSIKFPIPGDPPFVGGIAAEITERKRIEDELRDAVRTREEVLAVVSHDLRSPLHTIRLSASTLLAQTADHRIQAHVDIIHRSARRMDTLIEDLLETANIRSGRLKLDTKREVADSVVREALDLQEPLATEKGVTLVRPDDMPGVDLVCDRDRILQVFANLIGNALKFCRSGDAIIVMAERVGEQVRFSVADTGPGIAPEALPHLFEAYWSGPQQAKRGVGLGLYICRGIVEGHGGRISAEARPGAGATFSFTLPVSARLA